MTDLASGQPTSDGDAPQTQRLLTGKRALVTGASRGIGLAIAKTLAKEGATVLLSARKREALDAAVRDIAASGGIAYAIACDVTDAAAIAGLAAEIQREHGPLDILVSNAGFAESAPFVRTDRELWDRTIALNLTAAYEITQAFLPSMLAARSGRVIYIASVAGKVGAPYVTAYCAAKHGLIGLTKALALEVARKGVTVNAVCPSYVDTDMTGRSIDNIVQKTSMTPEAARAAIEQQNPQHRLIAPEEVANAVLYLASPAARGVNGQALNLCGGATPL